MVAGPYLVSKNGNGINFEGAGQTYPTVAQMKNGEAFVVAWLGNSNISVYTNNMIFAVVCNSSNGQIMNNGGPFLVTQSNSEFAFSLYFNRPSVTALASSDTFMVAFTGIAGGYWSNFGSIYNITSGFSMGPFLINTNENGIIFDN